MDNSLSRRQRADELGPLVFTSINDIPENPRLGLGYHQLYDPTRPVPLIARLPAVVRVGDVATLFWDDIEVQQYELDDSTIQKGWLSFSVSPNQVVGASNQSKAYYTLFDPLAGETRQSETRTIKVNRLVPGGLDPDTLTAINENLAAPSITPSIIDSAETAVNVSVPVWQNMELGDELTVLWNGIRVDRPPLTSIGQQVVLIPKDVLEQGGSNVRLPVVYEIRDIVDNYSLPSKTGFADVSIDPFAIKAPTVKEADPVTLILDLSKLAGNDATVSIPFYSGVSEGDAVTLTWIGRTGVSETTLKFGPETIGNAMPEFRIPNAHLQSIAGGSAVVSYDVVTSSGQSLHSKRTAITLTGLPVPLASPTIRGVNDTEIDLREVVGPSVFVLVAPYLGKQAGDKISLIWTGSPKERPPSHYTDDHIVLAGEESLEYAFEVSRLDNLVPLVDGTLQLQYQVVFAGTTSPVDSEIANFSVVNSSVAEGFDSITPPQIIRAGGSISTTTLSIHLLTGLGRVGFPSPDSLPIDPGDLKLPVLHICYQNPAIEPGVQKVRIDFKDEYTRLECSIHGASPKTTLTFLTAAQAPIGTVTLETRNYFPFSHSPGPRFRYLEITADKDWTRWDQFTLS